MFQLLLSVPKRFVKASLGQQCGVWTVSRHRAGLQHIDAVRVRYVGKAVRDDDDRPAPGQRADLSHDVVFALHVNVGCGFVEHIDRAVVQQRPGKRKAVALPAVEVHLSDVSAREAFRQVSYAGMACEKTYAGHGFEGYRLAMEYLCRREEKHD